MGNKCDLEDKREVDEDDIRVYNFNNLLYMIFFFQVIKNLNQLETETNWLF